MSLSTHCQAGRGSRYTTVTQQLHNIQKDVPRDETLLLTRSWSDGGPRRDGIREGEHKGSSTTVNVNLNIALETTYWDQVPIQSCLVSMAVPRTTQEQTAAPWAQDRHAKHIV